MEEDRWDKRKRRVPAKIQHYKHLTRAANKQQAVGQGMITSGPQRETGKAQLSNGPSLGNRPKTCFRKMLRAGPSGWRLYLILGRKVPAIMVQTSAWDHHLWPLWSWVYSFPDWVFYTWGSQGKHWFRETKTAIDVWFTGIPVLWLFLSSLLPMFPFLSAPTASLRSSWIWSTNLGAEAGFEIFWRVLNMPELTGLPGPAVISELPQTTRIVWQ